MTSTIIYNNKKYTLSVEEHENETEIIIIDNKSETLCEFYIDTSIENISDFYENHLPEDEENINKIIDLGPEETIKQLTTIFIEESVENSILQILAKEFIEKIKIDLSQIIHNLISMIVFQDLESMIKC